MICAAVSGVMTISTMPAETRLSQTTSGMRPSVMPGQRMHSMVVTMLIAAPMLPNPATRRRDGPVVGAVALRKCLGREWRVGEPADIGRAARPGEPLAAQKAEIEQQPAERAGPEAEGVEARKRHVAGADHQRHEIVGEPEHDRHADEKDHRRPVHREETIEHLRRHDGEVRIRELDPHDRGFEAADHEEDEGVDHIHDARAACDRR